MRKHYTTKKLNINKKTITNLDTTELSVLRGGDHITGGDDRTMPDYSCNLEVVIW